MHAPLALSLASHFKRANRAHTPRYRFVRSAHPLCLVPSNTTVAVCVHRLSAMESWHGDASTITSIVCASGAGVMATQRNVVPTTCGAAERNSIPPV